MKSPLNHQFTRNHHEIRVRHLHGTSVLLLHAELLLAAQCHVAHLLLVLLLDLRRRDGEGKRRQEVSPVKFRLGR